MKVGQAFPSKYLKADDLEDRDWTATIRDVIIEDIGQGEQKQEKLILYFNEFEKGLVTNKTNATTIQKLYGDETDEWVGKTIVLWPNHDVEFKGEIVSAIRVRSRAPKTPVTAGGHALPPASAITPAHEALLELVMEAVAGDMSEVEPYILKLTGKKGIELLTPTEAMAATGKIKKAKKSA